MTAAAADGDVGGACLTGSTCTDTTTSVCESSVCSKWLKKVLEGWY